MAVTATVKKVVTDSPYAAIGATDLAVERVRTAGTQIDALRAEVAPTKVQARLAGAPAAAQKTYGELATRGEKLVERVRKQKATQDLVGQAKATLALGKGLVTTARKTVDDVERTAKATLTTTRKEAVKAAEAVVDSVDVTVDTDKATQAVKSSAQRTRTAAKRTTTTAKKGAARTTTAAKSTTTAARTTAAKATKAAEKAAEKVGD
jgi:DNA-binding protein HU-beta